MWESHCSTFSKCSVAGNLVKCTTIWQMCCVPRFDRKTAAILNYDALQGDALGGKGAAYVHRANQCPNSTFITFFLTYTVCH